jgi:hypothetical protein
MAGVAPDLSDGLTSMRGSGWARLTRLVTGTLCPGHSGRHRPAVPVDHLDHHQVLQDVHAGPARDLAATMSASVVP